MSRKSKALEFVDVGYSINVMGRNVLVTEPMKDYAIEKVSKIERFNTRIIEVLVTMDIQKLEHRVDIIVRLDHIKIKAQASSDNMYASIDKATDKIQSQLRRYKRRIHEHQAKPLEVIDMNVNVLGPLQDEDLIEINEEIEDETQRRLNEQIRTPQIVKQETHPLKTLTLEEALLRINLSGDHFLIFRNEEDINRKINVIYLRDDGNYGVIELPEGS